MMRRGIPRIAPSAAATLYVDNRGNDHLLSERLCTGVVTAELAAFVFPKPNPKPDELLLLPKPNPVEVAPKPVPAGLLKVELVVPKPPVDDEPNDVFVDPKPVLVVDVPKPPVVVDAPKPVLVVDVPKPAFVDVPNPPVVVVPFVVFVAPKPVPVVDPKPVPVFVPNPVPVVEVLPKPPVVEVLAPKPVLPVVEPNEVVELDAPNPVYVFAPKPKEEVELFVPLKVKPLPGLFPLAFAFEFELLALKEKPEVPLVPELVAPNVKPLPPVFPVEPAVPKLIFNTNI